MKRGLLHGGPPPDFVAWAKTHVVTKELLGMVDENKKREQRKVDPKRLRAVQVRLIVARRALSPVVWKAKPL